MFSPSFCRPGCRPVSKCDSLCLGSKSDGQRSPNDTVFLRMDDIPFIHEDRPEGYGEDGERFEILLYMHIWCRPLISLWHARWAVRLSLHQLSVSGRLRGEPWKEAAAQTKWVSRSSLRAHTPAVRCVQNFRRAQDTQEYLSNRRRIVPHAAAVTLGTHCVTLFAAFMYQHVSAELPGRRYQQQQLGASLEVERAAAEGGSFTHNSTAVSR